MGCRERGRGSVSWSVSACVHARVCLAGLEAGRDAAGACDESEASFPQTGAEGWQRTAGGARFQVGAGITKDAEFGRDQRNWMNAMGRWENASWALSFPKVGGCTRRR